MRLVILDTGTLGLLTNPRARPDALACRQWAQSLLAAGTRVIVPGIADYELRRELIRARKTLGLRGPAGTVPLPTGNRPDHLDLIQDVIDDQCRASIPGNRER